ncbi:Protein MAIN-LIKE 1 [Glycine soja]
MNLILLHLLKLYQSTEPKQEFWSYPLLHIMVRTRGLGRALGQRVAVTTDHVDEPVIPDPDVQDDLMEAPAVVEDIPTDIPADAGPEAVEDQPQGFPGGPSDPSVLTAYADHVACSVWTGEERPELKLSSHGRKVHSLGRPVPAIEGLIAGTRLSPLIACSVDTGDRRLLSAFVERWHRETSSFHLPVGELAITLDDASSLLHLPIIVDFHAFEPLHVDDAVQMLVDLLMVSPESARAETVQCCGPYSETNIHVVYLEALRDLSMTNRYAWGVAALVHMYDQLNDASMTHSRQLGGYITLLQCWIYEHFPSIAESTADKDYDEASPRACRWIATKKTVKSIRTPSYRERLDRLRIPMSVGSRMGSIGRSETSTSDHATPVSCVGAYCCFGYTQTIPAPPVDSWVSYDDIHDRWMHYEDHIVLAGEVCVVPGACSSDYIDWFFRISHPFMTPGHAVDPLPHGHAPQPRVVPQAPQTDIPRVPEPGASSTSMEEPRHAVEVCDDIAERLERHLSLGVVTRGSLTHEVIEECLRLARSVTQDHLVYVRCRRRRHTDQA